MDMYKIILDIYRLSLVAQMVKNMPATTMQETRVWSLGQEELLEKEMATYASILVWDRGSWRATAHWVTRVGHD